MTAGQAAIVKLARQAAGPLPRRFRIGLRCTIALTIQLHALTLVAAYAWFTSH